MALLGSEPKLVHVPGPNGLPGGYPVMATDGNVALSLPDGISTEEAVEFNGRMALEEGTAVVNTDGFVAFSETARDAIKRQAASLAEGFPAGDLDHVVEELLGLRTNLDR
jgi:hypothetical protein